MTAPAMPKSEREDLQRLVRQREKVLEFAAKQRSADLLADDHVAARDRAAVVTTAIIQIVVSALRRWNAGDLADLASVRAEIAATLREEFADVEQQVLNEIRLND